MFSQRDFAGASDSTVLRGFYSPVHDVSRLCTASAVERSLDPRSPDDGTADAWRSDCSIPDVLEKVTLDLYILRTQLQHHAVLSERAQRMQHGDLVEGCVHFYNALDSIVELVDPELAGGYLRRAVRVYNRRPHDSGVLSRDAHASLAILAAFHGRRYRRALVLYVRAQIREGLDAGRRREGGRAPVFL